MPRDLAEQQKQLQIAQTAARLIAEHGLSDWNLAKRKAARQLGLSERQSLPNNQAIETALHEYHRLFRHDSQAQHLLEQRRLALRWMERLSSFEPELTQGVAAGWATEHSEIHIELIADDPKRVEFFLLNEHIAFTLLPKKNSRDVPDYRLDEEGHTVVLVVLSPGQRRQKGRQEERLNLAKLRGLLY